MECNTRTERQVYTNDKKFYGKVKKNPDAKECIDFSDKGISPSQLKDILENDLGFEEVDFDKNGWQWDFWITMRKDGADYMIAGTGMSFEIVFRLA